VKVEARAGSDNSEDRIAYEVWQFGLGNTPKPSGSIRKGWEPTWADSSKIIKSVHGLKSSNYLTLLSAFGALGLDGPKRMRVVRNACAHKTRLNRNEVGQLRIYYLNTHFLEPIDIIWGISHSRNSIAVFEWIEDLESIADLATR